jgi:hypothetical protein
MMLIEIDDYYFPHDKIVVKAEGKKKVKIWTVGASAVDGAFLVDCPIEEVLEKVGRANLIEREGQELLEMSAEKQADLLARLST